MGKGSGGTRGSARGGGGAMAKAKEEYEAYVHGGGYYDEIGESIFGEKTEKQYEHMDALFQPAKEDIVLYRGTSTEELNSIMDEAGISGNDVNELVGKTFTSTNFKSTTEQKRYADDYASDIYDYSQKELNSRDLRRNLSGNEEYNGKVLIRYEVAKGTPVVKRADVTDTIGRGAQHEHTIRRNVQMKVKSVTKKWDSLYDDRYEYELVIQVGKKG